MEKTMGERRVRTDFNVSGDDDITRVKQMYARQIDDLEEMKEKLNTGDEKGIDAIVCIEATQLKIEEAAMWHVKALTL